MYYKMKNGLQRRQTSFRLRTDLIEGLKKAAERENRTLNNYVEYILLKVVYSEPNDTTVAAIKEATSPENNNTVYNTAEELLNDLNKE